MIHLIANGTLLGWYEPFLPFYGYEFVLMPVLILALLSIFKIAFTGKTGEATMFCLLVALSQLTAILLNAIIYFKTGMVNPAFYFLEWLIVSLGLHIVFFYLGESMK